MQQNEQAISGSSRITSMDVVRGLVVVLMAIDHVRVYSGQPAGGPSAGIFFTRWVTHFVAPGFAFFAGTGAFLHGAKLGDRGKLARFLWTRGVWLVLLELTFMRFAWTFNFDYAHYSLAGVLWMLGWCMVLMAVIIYLPTWAIATFGIATMLLHPALNALRAAAGHSTLSWLFQILYFGGGFSIGKDGPPLLILFVIIPWIGVMAAGYAFGPVMRWTAERRRRFCLTVGIGATLAFVVLRGAGFPGDPRSWHHMIESEGYPWLLAFLNTSKYPASPFFLLMTLGPLLTLLPLIETAHDRAFGMARAAISAGDPKAAGPARILQFEIWAMFEGILQVFGRVPLFFYILHIPLIHLAAVVVSVIRTGAVNPWLFANHPLIPGPVPPGYTWSLPLLYLVWTIVIVILFFPCSWYNSLKARKKSPWLSYV